MVDLGMGRHLLFDQIEEDAAVMRTKHHIFFGRQELTPQNEVQVLEFSEEFWIKSVWVWETKGYHGG